MSALEQHTKYHLVFCDYAQKGKLYPCTCRQYEAAAELADQQTRLEKAEATVKEYQLVCGGKTPEKTAEFLTELLLKIMLGNAQLDAMIKEVAEIKKALGSQ